MATDWPKADVPVGVKLAASAYSCKEPVPSWALADVPELVVRAHVVDETSWRWRNRQGRQETEKGLPYFAILFLEADMIGYLPERSMILQESAKMSPIQHIHVAEEFGLTPTRLQLV